MTAFGMTEIAIEWIEFDHAFTGGNVKRMLVGILVLWISSVHLPALAQSPSAQSTAQQAHAEVLTQTESVDLLKGLNDKGKLVPEAFIANVRLRTLNGEDCSGVRTPKNLRLVIHSARQGYGYSGKLSVQQKDSTFVDEYFQWIGVLHAEFAFSIDDQQFLAGSYALEAFGDSLRFVGNDEKAKYYDARRARHVPQPMTRKLSVKVPIPDSVTRGTQGASVSLVVKEGVILMSVLGNEWKIDPR
jgi:hypothetical protein